MNILTVSNLFPRPDRPQCGMFNLQLFRAMAERPILAARVSVTNVVFVPEWRPWRWRRIREWGFEGGRPDTSYVPVVHVPVLGRNLSAVLHALALCRWYAVACPPCDVLYASWLYPDGVAAARLGRRLGKPVWIMVLGTDSLHLQHAVRRRAIRRAAEQVAGFVCVCRSLADRLVAAGVAADKVHVVPNGVDASRFHYRPRRDALGRLSKIEGGGEDVRSRVLSALRDEPGRKVLLFVGNLVGVKCPELLVSALAEWFRAAPDVAGPVDERPRVVVIGDGPLRRSLETMADGLGTDVSFLGTRPHEEIALWMNVADVLCLSSRSEGMPNVVLEAVASGLPVVATDVGACREILGDEPNARLVAWAGQERETATRYASAVCELVRVAPDREAMSRRNRDRFSWHRQAEGILGLMGRRGVPFRSRKASD